MITFDVPNLDCEIDPNDLMELRKSMESLSLYCLVKAKAMQARLDGRINEALALEAQNDRIYSSLPEWARW